MENPIKMDDLGVPLFLETPICDSVIPSILKKKNMSGQWMVTFQQNPS